MSTLKWSASGVGALPTAIIDADTARLQHRVRVAVIELLAAATPSGWEVVDSSTWAKMTLDIAVRPHNGPDEQSLLPVLCVDLTAGEGANADRRRRQRRCALAGVGVDHYWDLDTQAKILDVYVRADDEYRHAERLTGADWVDYGVGLLHLNLPLLLESHAEREEGPGQHHHVTQGRADAVGIRAPHDGGLADTSTRLERPWGFPASTPELLEIGGVGDAAARVAAVRRRPQFLRAKAEEADEADDGSADRKRHVASSPRDPT